MGRIAAVIIVVPLFSFMLAGSAQAATPNLAKCLELTSAHAMSVNIDDLGIAAQVKRAARARIVTYNSATGFADLEGIGLTPDQISTIQGRIDAKVASWNAHPLGWPCAAFTHRTKTVAWVRAKLVANGFRPASLRVTKAVPRQIQLVGIQDGIDVWMTVARTGPKGVAIRLTTTHSGGGTYAYVLPFVP